MTAISERPSVADMLTVRLATAIERARIRRSDARAAANAGAAYGRLTEIENQWHRLSEVLDCFFRLDPSTSENGVIEVAAKVCPTWSRDSVLSLTD